MNKYRKIIIACILLVLIVPFVVSGFSDNVSLKNIEADARQSQQVPENYLVAKAEGDDMVAMVFYPQDKSDHIFSIYIKDNKLLNRYRFISGGSMFTIDENVLMHKENDSTAVLSLNNCNIVKIGFSNAEEHTVKPNRPFAFVLNNNVTATFTDIDGEYITPNNWIAEG